MIKITDIKDLSDIDLKNLYFETYTMPKLENRPILRKKFSYFLGIEIAKRTLKKEK